MNSEANTTMNSDMNDQTMPDESAERLTHAIYGLQLATFITVITLFIAVIINYIKRKDVRGTLYEKHFDWQIRTFWVLVIIMAAAILLFSVVMAGYFLFDITANLEFLALVSLFPLAGLVSAVYLIYRVARGWLCLNENQPPPGDKD